MQCSAGVRSDGPEYFAILLCYTRRYRMDWCKRAGAGPEKPAASLEKAPVAYLSTALG